jgi:hypothetical protein
MRPFVVIILEQLLRQKSHILKAVKQVGVQKPMGLCTCWFRESIKELPSCCAFF